MAKIKHDPDLWLCPCSDCKKTRREIARDLPTAVVPLGRDRIERKNKIAEEIAESNRKTGFIFKADPLHECSRQGSYRRNFVCRLESDGDFYIDVDAEYSCDVNFCPFCGYSNKDSQVNS